MASQDSVVNVVIFAGGKFRKLLATPFQEGYFQDTTPISLIKVISCLFLCRELSRKEQYQEKCKNFYVNSRLGHKVTLTEHLLSMISTVRKYPYTLLDVISSNV